MRHDGIDAELADAGRDRHARCRGSTCRGSARFPIVGGLLQPRAGTARHDAVAWGYARAADRRGVDIIENCEVTGFLRDGDRITGVDDHARRNPRQEGRRSRSPAAPDVSCSWPASRRLPIESHVLQAFVIGIAEAVHRHASSPSARATSTCRSPTRAASSIGGDIDGYNSYAQRGNLPVVEEVMSEMLALFPSARARPPAALLGRRHATCRWTARRSSPPARCPACISIAAGATAASRRRRPPAGASPGRSPRTSRTRSTRRSRSTASIAAS